VVVKTTIDIEEFQLRLAQTIAWCSSRIVAEEPATCLRSFGLRPPGSDVAKRHNLPWDEIVTSISQVREKWLHYPGELPTGLADGRLLIASGITESLVCGAAEAESLGFIDGEDLPPWDTWLCYLRDEVPNQAFPGQTSRYEYIVSWVPPEFFDFAQGAIEVNCAGCINWAEDVDTAFTRQLREAGLF
jgi:hypothetical protein